jgi:Flp pilus assembly protein TadG
VTVTRLVKSCRPARPSVRHLLRFARQRICRACPAAAGGGAGLGDERGDTIVEFAMGALILFMVLFGIMAMALALYSYNVVSELAREGTRYAIVRGAKCHFASACPASTGDIQTYVKNIGFPGINPNSVTAATSWSAYPVGTLCAPSVSCNNPGNQVKVTVSYQFPLVIPFVPSRTLSMSSTAEMVISQ